MSEPNTQNVRPTRRPSGQLLALAAQNTTGAGATYALGAGFTNFSVQLFRASTGSSGGSTKASVRLQGSLDGSHWFTVGAATLAVTGTAGVISARASTFGPVTYARLSINSFTTATNANPDKVKVTGHIAVA